MTDTPPFSFTEDQVTESRAILDQDIAGLTAGRDFHCWADQLIKCVDTIHDFALVDLEKVPDGEREEVLRFMRHHVEGTAMLMAKFAHEVEYEGLLP